jgi:hypothetical protein
LIVQAAPAGSSDDGTSNSNPGDIVEGRRDDDDAPDADPTQD